MVDSSSNKPAPAPAPGPGRMIIDRFEGDFAVCESEGPCGRIERTNVPKCKIDCRAGEGAVIYFCGKHNRYHFDARATEQRAAYIRSLTEGMWQ